MVSLKEAFECFLYFNPPPVWILKNYFLVVLYTLVLQFQIVVIQKN
eukprot:UN11220